MLFLHFLLLESGDLYKTFRLHFFKTQLSKFPGCKTGLESYASDSNLKVIFYYFKTPWGLSQSCYFFDVLALFKLLPTNNTIHVLKIKSYKTGLVQAPNLRL